ncbi:hypothetical protein COCCADRAFT_90237 [Bipolaris zeicola 26-R-13]|uniref:Uncharacterized protein n=1 Tax=Cochliobolus carbonum (strain 26-R-13) TaxID=930089 RepID=W6Y7M2_COCC2|nr:uncharacterized protein COCCADRAFT_90237 [Bipolaris zeicola 26-R-13]EUC35622.1 hypothetical protein COCCADRAFT_90237 [Bipolaris zeicola 26-R-13]
MLDLECNNQTIKLRQKNTPQSKNEKKRIVSFNYFNYKIISSPPPPPAYTSMFSDSPNRISDPRVRIIFFNNPPSP